MQKYCIFKNSMWKSYAGGFTPKRPEKKDSSSTLIDDFDEDFFNKEIKPTDSNLNLKKSQSSNIKKNNNIVEKHLSITKKNSQIFNFTTTSLSKENLSVKRNFIRKISTVVSDDPKLLHNDSETSKINRSLNKKTSYKTKFPTHLDMFEGDSHSNRPAPKLPTTDGIEYPRAASWSSSTVAEIMRDPLGRQMFRCFLFESLAEENLLFVEAIDKLRLEKVPENIKKGLLDLLDQYGSYINLSSVAMTKLKEAANNDNPDTKCLEYAHKEIYKLLENDQFPRFRRSQIYLNYLEKLLPKTYAEKWMTSFDALLGNQVGRHHFRQYLFSVHAEENLRFWESVVEFRGTKNKSTAMLNMGRTIQQQFLREGAHNEVFLPFGLRQKIEKKIKEKDVDETLFDDAVKHVEQILKNDPYVRFLQSKEYQNLLEKLN